MATLESTAGVRPFLPLEIMSAIVGELSRSHDVDHLVCAWTTCRLLSRQIKKEVESAFYKTHLPRTYVRFDQRHNLHNPFRSIWFNFDRLSDDGITATFVPSKLGYPPTTKDLRQIFQRLAKPTSKRVVVPTQGVRIGRDFNDIEIPYTSLRIKSKEIVVDWKRLYALFFSEEKLQNDLFKEWKDENAIPWAKKRRDEGKDLLSDETFRFLDRVSRASKECRNVARRRRIQHQHITLLGLPLVVNKLYLRREGRAVNDLHQTHQIVELLKSKKKKRSLGSSTNHKPTTLKPSKGEVEDTYDADNDGKAAESDWSDGDEEDEEDEEEDQVDEDDEDDDMDDSNDGDDFEDLDDLEATDES